MPEIKINKELLQTLCSYQASDEEVCSILETDFETLKAWVKKEYKKDWDSFYSQFSAKGKVKIRENQINLSRKSPEMAKHLGEKYLNDDKIEQKPTENKQNKDKFEQNLTKYLQNQTKFSKLTAKQQSFVVYYICTNNATQSAAKAGYSEATAGSQGARLLKDVTISKLVSDAKTQQFEEAEDQKTIMITKLDEIIDHPNSTPNEKINAIKTKAMLLGLNAPNKSQLLGKDGEIILPTIITFTDGSKN